MAWRSLVGVRYKKSKKNTVPKLLCYFVGTSCILVIAGLFFSVIALSKILSTFTTLKNNAFNDQQMDN